jgi:hypothetical protein
LRLLAAGATKQLLLQTNELVLGAFFLFIPLPVARLPMAIDAAGVDNSVARVNCWLVLAVATKFHTQ